MNIVPLINGVGQTGFFTNRAFLPAFMTAATLRYGDSVPFVSSTGLIDQAAETPTWFTHEYTVLGLGALAALEVAAEKIPEAREFKAETDRYLKAGMAAVTYMGVASATDIAFAEEIIQKAGILDIFPAFLTAIAVFFSSGARNSMMLVLAEADEEDDLGLQQLISWGEDLWVIGGLILLLFFPIFMLCVIGISIGVLMAMQKWSEVREERKRVPCANCGTQIYPCAMACPSCSTPVTQPVKIGFLGGSKKKPCPSIQDQPYRLVEKRRCPVCATRFPNRAMKQTCEACSHELMSESGFQEAYMGYVDRRLPGVLIVSTLLSLIPVIGLVPGVLVYRMQLVAPYRRYIPLGRRLVTKWLMRFLFFFLIMFQWVPILGGLTVPVMALLSHSAYRGAFGKTLVKNGLAEK